MEDKILDIGKCPNCGGNRYAETIHTEQCGDCGLFLDYKSGYGNDIYLNMINRNNQQSVYDEIQRGVKHDRDFNNWFGME